MTPNIATPDFRGHDIGDDEHVKEMLASQLEIGLEVLGKDATYIPCTFGNCQECQEYVRGHLALADGSWKLVLRNEACPFPSGMPAYETFIDAPSGVLMLGGNLCPLVPEIPPFKYNINSSVGQRAHNEAYADKGLGYVMADSCGMRAVAINGGITIGKNAWAGDDEEIKLPGRPLGKIQSNGLRAVGVMDLGRYEELARAHGLLTDDLASQVEIARGLRTRRWAAKAVSLDGGKDDTLANLAVAVEPGRYRITHYYHMPSEKGQPWVCARIDRVQEAA